QQDAAAHDRWFREQVQIGIDAANAGDVLSADEVEAEAEAWRAETRRKIAAS
ncbi:putative transcriptional regulator, partial [Kerstersia gyiorum]|nr:putative transcriptional regulator [Kerstersia gyiorum]